MTGEAHDDDAYELFYSTFDWFVGHLEAVAAEPAVASEMHGHYNVAYELWYFVGRERLVLSDPLHLFSDDVRASLVSAVQAVSAVPREARVWTTIVEESLTNLQHPAWIPARHVARDAMRLLAPAIAQMKAFVDAPRSKCDEEGRPPGEG